MARLLLDTNALIWALADPGRLRVPVREQLEDVHTRVYASAASSWEMAIKVALGKLKVPPALDSWLSLRLAEARIAELPITVRHTFVVEHLPPLHNDPFDRILIAQALTEGLTLVTRDPLIAEYQVPVLRC